MPVDDVGNLSREEEESLSEARRKNEESREKLLSTYHEFIDTKPELFMRVICEGILGIHNADYQNPFLDLNEGKFNGLGLLRGYSDTAALVLYRLDKGQSAQGVSEYISLMHYVNNNAGEPRCPPKRKFHNPDNQSMAWSLVLGLEEYFGQALHYAYELIYHGVPIYTYDETKGAYERAPFSNADYVFMSRLGRHSMDIRTGQYPEWIKEYWFKGSDIAAHDIFFRGELPDESGIDALRDAYRRHLFPDGVINKEHCDAGITASIKSQIHANLLRAIADFPARYPNIKSKPPKLDADVRPWLKSSGYASNEREAHVFGSIIAEQFKLSADT